MTIHRVLYINHVGLVAGAERSLVAMIQALDRSRYAPFVICPPGPLRELLTRAGAEVRNAPLQRFHRTSNPLRLSYHALSVLRVVMSIVRNWVGPRPHLIHSNNTTAHLYGVMLAKFLRVPCVWHVRDLTPLGLLGRMLYARSNAVVATSRAVAYVVRRMVGADAKVHVIPNGIDVNAVASPDAGAQIRAELALSESTPLLVVVGQFVRWKAQDVFLRAMPEVIHRWPQAVALIVGDDLFGDNAAYKSELLALPRELGIAKNVKFLGWRPDVSALIQACDLVVVPSHAEPFGRVALEAMVAGKPVVGTRAGGLLDVVAEGVTGWLVPPYDHAALSAAICEALADRERAQRMGQAGRKRVEELFDIRITTQAVERLYDSLLSQSAGRD